MTEPDSLAEVERRLDVLENLAPGWNSYDAAPISKTAIAAARITVRQFLQPGIRLPYVVPISDGGVQLEWHTGGIDLEIEFDAEGRIEVFLDDLKGEVSEWREAPGGTLDRVRAALARLGPP